MASIYALCALLFLPGVPVLSTLDVETKKSPTALLREREGRKTEKKGEKIFCI